MPGGIKSLEGVSKLPWGNEIHKTIFFLFPVFDPVLHFSHSPIPSFFQRYEIDKDKLPCNSMKKSAHRLHSEPGVDFY